MLFRQFQPIEPLRRYVLKIWYFSSDIPLPKEDMKLIVPTGRIKLLVPFRPVSTIRMNGIVHTSKEHSITLIGITDAPHQVSTDDPTGTIGIEFSAAGAYRFFQLHYQELRNHMFPLTELFGRTARELQQLIEETDITEQKVALLQQYLFQQLTLHSEDNVFDFCVQKILQSKGQIPVQELERQTGFSSRWLNMKFMQRAGISPKNLASIIRFQEIYQTLLQKRTTLLPRTFYDHYYDQSHFIRDFKRFTGMPPSKLEKIVNEFGRQYAIG